MKTITDFRKESVLRKTYAYEIDGKRVVMTRGEWIGLMKNKGARVEQKEVRNYAAEDKLRDSIDRRKWSIPFGNECHPLTREWNEDKERLKKGIYKTVYRLYENPNESAGYDLTKIEYDYFGSL